MTDAVPIIDLGPWWRGDPEQRAAVTAAVDETLRRWGFMLITDHGVPTRLRDDLRAASRAFFALPDPVKRRYATGVDGRGWLPPGVEANGYSEGTATPADLKESLSFGADTRPATPPSTRDGSSPTGGRRRSPVWSRCCRTTWPGCGPSPIS